ncbi:hypothetical protein B0H10DRAFT_1964561 [Mycena sp. CBHHK59/15]|nr:hypothetical protein B0H10DRAFT_1964561 [Mycena sp. CBHHK59/15]
MTGFDEIHDELTHSGDSDAGGLQLSPEARQLMRLTTMPILKALCHESGCKIGGKKDELVDRLLIHFRSIKKQPPSRADIDRIRKTLAATSTPALSNTTNLPKPKATSTTSKKRSHADANKENSSI